MSKLFELLQQTAKGSDRANSSFKNCQLIVFTDGTATVLVNHKPIAAGMDEGEIIAGLNRLLTEKSKAEAAGNGKNS